ncbi:hypothetical protein EJ05DRAFT_44769 [Pseudovirgaria hyperparasitica]|uniref:Uncharacterized protein n=1 Tax=Pseudovirgaria hyperparasitica TaxID=470096 RepID=A0A6A6W5H9_9PEZI|nr:uncharacterized protein EJ05DRAFT_44769 [Pseudovirgaria hyperparasitica]KAF2756817.1 hypothetical protein EJ05DRAFT_44769 [Pseudovirgaria hyperparasitica]
MADQTQECRFSLSSTLSPGERESHDTIRTQTESGDEVELLRQHEANSRQSEDDTQADRANGHEQPSKDRIKFKEDDIAQTTLVVLPTPSCPTPTPPHCTTHTSSRSILTSATDRLYDISHKPQYASGTSIAIAAALPGAQHSSPRIRSPLPSLGPQIPINRLEGGPLKHKLRMNEKFEKFVLTRTTARRRALFAVFIAVMAITVVGVIWGLQGSRNNDNTEMVSRTVSLKRSIGYLCSEQERREVGCE